MVFVVLAGYVPESATSCQSEWLCIQRWIGSEGAREVGFSVPHHPAVEPVVADIVVSRAPRE